MALITQISQLAKDISLELLLPNFAKVKAAIKQDGSWLTIADTLAHQRLIEVLPTVIDCPVLSEEMTDTEQQAVLEHQPASYWCIDPLDGTSNFTMGIPYWCMSIAFIEDAKLKLAVIYDPNRDECFAAADGVATTLNGELLTSNAQDVTDLKSCMGLIDFKRLDRKKASSLAAEPPYRSQRSFGSSALDLCWIAANRCQLYLHGQQKLWDHGAGLLILKNAGAFAETFDGEEIFQNNLTPKSVIAASNFKLMQQWKNYFHSL